VAAWPSAPSKLSDRSHVRRGARQSWRIPNPLLRLTLTSGSLNVYSLINECEM